MDWFKMEFPKAKYDYVDDWFLVSSPVTMFLIWISYLAFVLKVGPAIFKNRPPLKLKNVLIIYNMFQVCYSIKIVCIGVPLIMRHGLVHRECLLEEFPSCRDEILQGSWFYFMGKLSELLDTVFFVLRKKSNQITFLHVYHHSIMLILSWLFIKYIPTDSAVFLGTINSFVHIIMYAYYGLSAMGPKVAKYLTWKKYITTMQLVQFACILVQLNLQQYWTTCKASGLPVFIISVPNLILFLYLFGDFYYQAYSKTKTNNALSNGHSLNGKINGKNMNGKSEMNGKFSMKGSSSNGHYSSKATKAC